MKIYQLTDQDIDRLKSAMIKVDRDNIKNNYDNDEKSRFISEIYRVYNYYIYEWIGEVTK